MAFVRAEQKYSGCQSELGERHEWKKNCYDIDTFTRTCPNERSERFVLKKTPGRSKDRSGSDSTEPPAKRGAPENRWADTSSQELIIDTIAFTNAKGEIARATWAGV